MQPISADHAANSRLRFVYKDALVSFSVAAGATFGEIAETLSSLAGQRRGRPVAIDLTLVARSARRADA